MMVALAVVAAVAIQAPAIWCGVIPRGFVYLLLVL